MSGWLNQTAKYLRSYAFRRNDDVQQTLSRGRDRLRPAPSRGSRWVTVEIPARFIGGAHALEAANDPPWCVSLWSWGLHEPRPSGRALGPNRVLEIGTNQLPAQNARKPSNQVFHPRLLGHCWCLIERYPYRSRIKSVLPSQTDSSNATALVTVF